MRHFLKLRVWKSFIAIRGLKTGPCNTFSPECCRYSLPRIALAEANHRLAQVLCGGCSSWEPIEDDPFLLALSPAEEGQEGWRDSC